MKFKKNISKRIFASIIVSGILLTQFSFVKPVIATEPPNISFGVVSDVHLTDSTDLSQQEINLKNSFLKFKENNAKVIMIAGDIANLGQAVAYQKVNTIFDQVFTDVSTRPQKVFVMGNHDYSNGMTATNAQNNFTQTLGVSLNTNIAVDGYHFIGVSTEDGAGGGTYSTISKTWLKQQLDAAILEDATKPIFVAFHHHIRNTVYLSNEWFNESLDEVLKDYPQVVTFSGHSHAVLDDERSIYQKDYTSVGTSTLFFTELETGKANGTVPPRAYEVAQGIIGDITDAAVTLERYDFHNDCKIKNDWVIDLPVNKAGFKYTDARISASVAPYFTANSAVTASNITKTSCNITFDQAKDADFVHSYRIQAYNKSTNTLTKDFLIFSDFYLGLQRMAPTYSYSINGLSADTNYEIRVYGIESFGKQSAPIITTIKTDGDINSSTYDVLNVNFSDGLGKDISDYNTSFQFKQNAAVSLDSTLHKKVLALNGSSYVNYAINNQQLSAITNQFTLETVFKMNTLKSQAIVENCQGSGIGFESTSSGRVELWAKIGSAYKNVGVQLSAGVYYHLAATYDGTQIKLYLNGSLVSSLANVTGPVTYTSGVAMCFGGDPDLVGNASMNLDGNIALVRIMNKAITAQEAADHYSQFGATNYAPVMPQGNSSLYSPNTGFVNAAIFSNGITFTNNNGVIANNSKDAENSCIVKTAISGLTQMVNTADNSNVNIDTLSFVTKTKLTIQDIGTDSWKGAGVMLRYDTTTLNRMMLRYSQDGILRVTGFNGVGVDYLAAVYVPQATSMNITIVQTKGQIDAFINDILYLSYTIPSSGIYYAMPYAFGLYSVYSVCNLSETSIYFLEKVYVATMPPMPQGNATLYNPYSGFANDNMYANGVNFTHSVGVLASSSKTGENCSVLNTSVSGLSQVVNPIDNSKVNIDTLTFVTKSKLTITDIGTESWHGAGIILRYNPTTKRHMMLRYSQDGTLRITGFYIASVDYLASVSVTPLTVMNFTVMQTKNTVNVSINDILVLSYTISNDSPYLTTPYAFGLYSVYSLSNLTETSLYFAEKAALVSAMPQGNANLYDGNAGFVLPKLYAYNNVGYTNLNDTVSSTSYEGENASVVKTAISGQTQMISTIDDSKVNIDALTLVTKTKLSITAIGTVGWYGAGFVLRHDATTNKRLTLRYSIDGNLRLIGIFGDRIDYLCTVPCAPNMSEINFTVLQTKNTIHAYINDVLYLTYTLASNSTYLYEGYAFGLQSVYSLCKLTDTSMYFVEKVYPVEIGSGVSFKIANKYMSGFTVNSKVSDLKAGISGSEISNVEVLGSDNSSTTDANLIATGMNVKITDKNNHIYQYKAVVYGDVNEDGMISALDLVNVKKHILKVSALSEISLVAADLTAKGNVSISDLLKVKKQILGTQNISQNTSAQSGYNFENYMTPFWTGTTVYNESAMIVANADGSIDLAPLTYKADNILSIRDSELTKEYVKGIDWDLQDGKIKILSGSRIPITAYTDFYLSAPMTSYSFGCTKGGYIFYSEGTIFHKKQIAVTYTHSESWTGPVPASKITQLPKTVAKLQNNQPLNVLFYGDSITVGYNTSGLVGIAPNTPSWCDMFLNSLKLKYNNTNITSVNTAVGGTTSVWGAANATTLGADKHPDLAVIAFGMNDGGSTSLANFKINIKAIMDTIKATNPDCEFILIAPMVPNAEVSINLVNVPYYYSVLSELEQSGVVMANVTEIHQYLLTKKRFYDMTGNNINHTNDFLARMYAQTVTALF